MTTLSRLTSVPDREVRPVPWRSLAWVAWRQSRTALAATFGVVGLLAAYYLVSGHQIHTDYATWQACSPRHSSACQFLSSNFFNKYGSTGPLGFVQNLVPVLIGAFVGAPILARELETGTVRYAWTQGVGRVRWALALLAPGAIVSAVTVAAFGAVVDWRYHPLVEAGVTQRLDPSLFPASAPAVVGWALAGFGIGVLTGLLWRRVLAAVATTVVIGFGLAVLTSVELRGHYLPPKTTTGLQINSTGMQVDQWWTKGGRRVSDGQLNQALQSAGVQGSISHGGTHAQATPGSTGTDPIQYLIHHGYTQWTSYQPDSRYWTLQWIEFGWLTALALITATIAVLLLRRRDA
jgi:hypothetical protein